MRNKHFLSPADVAFSSRIPRCGDSPPLPPFFRFLSLCPPFRYTSPLMGCLSSACDSCSYLPNAILRFFDVFELSFTKTWSVWRWKETITCKRSGEGSRQTTAPPLCELLPAHLSLSPSFFSYQKRRDVLALGSLCSCFIHLIFV